MGMKNLILNKYFDFPRFFNPEIDVVEYVTYSPKLDIGEEKKVVLIGDLHGYHNDIEKCQKLIETIRKQEPHHIVIAGDIMQGKKWDDDNALVKLQEFLINLSYIAPVITILGNHDIFGWNDKNSKHRKENYLSLKGKNENIHPLYNTEIQIEDFKILGLVPSHNLISSLSIQITGRAHDLFIAECQEEGITFSPDENSISEVICHNPHLLCQPGKTLNNGGILYEIALMAHTHGGSIPTKLRKIFPEFFLDRGIVERPYTISQDGGIIGINPLIYGTTNLCSGVIYTDSQVQQQYMQLADNRFYENIANSPHDRKWSLVKDNETVKQILQTSGFSANVITTGIRKMGTDMRPWQPEVTVLNVCGTRKPSEGKIRKKIKEAA